MEMSEREIWTVIHGMGLGAIYLLAFGGALAGMWSFRPGFLTAAAVRERMTRLYVGFGAMCVTAWATVITGTFIVYPWYRVKLAGAEFEKCAGLDLPSAECSPRDFLLSGASGETQEWHHLGMEWKEHVAWLAPLLATSAFLLVLVYGARLITNPRLRNAVLILLVASFAAAVIAGAFGAFITKVAPVL